MTHFCISKSLMSQFKEFAKCSRCACILVPAQMFPLLRMEQGKENSIYLPLRSMLALNVENHRTIQLIDENLNVQPEDWTIVATLRNPEFHNLMSKIDDDAILRSQAASDDLSEKTWIAIYPAEDAIDTKVDHFNSHNRIKNVK